MQLSSNFRENPYFDQILGLRAPLGSKLCWAPLTKILDPPLALDSGVPELCGLYVVPAFVIVVIVQILPCLGSFSTPK